MFQHIARRAPRLVAALVALALAATVVPLHAETTGQVNINTATVQELALLPYVGDSVAQKIVDHRAKNGPFKSVEDLMLVRGIGDKSFARLKPYVTITGKTTLGEKVHSPRPSSGSAAAKAPAQR